MYCFHFSYSYNFGIEFCWNKTFKLTYDLLSRDCKSLFGVSIVKPRICPRDVENNSFSTLFTFKQITHFNKITTFRSISKSLNICFLDCFYWQLSLSGVDFINILRTRFSYKNALRSFSLVMFWLYNFLAKKYWQKKLE